MNSKYRFNEASDGNRLDVKAYLEHYSIPIKTIKPHESSTLYVLENCVFDANHKGGESAIGQAADGKLFYHCYHDSCHGHNWHEARQIISGDDRLSPFMIKAEVQNSGQPDVRDFRFISAGELCQQPTPTKWIIKGILDAGTLSCLFGPPESMKSFIAIDMGLSIAANVPWHGHDIRLSGPVFYICGEGQNGISRRIKAWALYHNIDMDKIPFFVSERPARFLANGGAEEVSKAVTKLAVIHGDPVLVIIDTLNRNFGPGDESNTEDMTKFVNAIDDSVRIKFNCTVMPIHHTGVSNIDRGRGSSVLYGSLDWEYQILRNEKVNPLFDISNHFENDTSPSDLPTLLGRITMTCTKAKDHAKPAPIGFAPTQIPLGWIDPEDGEEMTSVILLYASADNKNTKAKAGTKPLRGAKKVAYDTLVKECNGQQQRIHIDIWREAAYTAGVSPSSEPDAKRKAFRRAVPDLLDMGLVDTIDDHWWPTALEARTNGQISDMSGTCPGTYPDRTGHSL